MLLEVFEAVDTQIEVKFDKTVKVTSITNDKFTLFTGGSTPVTTPFEDIDLVNDYDTISRRLVLRFKSALTPSTTYTFTISGLLDAAGAGLPSQTETFTTGASVLAIPTVAEPEPVEIEDHSVRSEAFSPETVFVSNIDFYIEEVDPDFDSVWVEEDYNNGRVTVKFSDRPSTIYVNSKYFKVQKKTIQRAPSRWETVAALITLDSTYPYVYIDFPSDDATPVYGQPEKTYFLANNKYRIRVSREVGT